MNTVHAKRQSADEKAVTDFIWSGLWLRVQGLRRVWSLGLMDWV